MVFVIVRKFYLFLCIHVSKRRKMCISVQVLTVGQKETPPTRWRQYTAGVAACMSLVASGAWFCWPTPLLPRLLAPDSPVPMNIEEASWMVSCVEVGNLISPFPATFFSDRYGRKLCILLCAPLFFVGLCLMIFIRTIPSLCLSRIIHGFSMGIPYTILPLYLGEIASTEARGTVTSFFHIAWGLGCLFPYCVGPFLSYEVFTYVTFLLTIFFVLCFVWQPETPYYHAMRNNTAEISKVLIRLRDSPTDDMITKELEEIQLEVKKSLEESSTWKDVFATPADRRALLLIFIVGIVSFLSGQNAILTYATETFSRFPNNYFSPESVTIAIGFVALIGSIFSIFTSDRCGRRFLLLISSIGCMLSLFIGSAYFYIFCNTDIDVTSYSWVAPLAIIFYNLFVTAGMHPVCVTYTSELFPTKTRGVASSISCLNLTFCSFLVLKSYETVSRVMGVYFIYLCYAITCFIGTILFYFMMPETKGKTFLEIRQHLEEKKN